MSLSRVISNEERDAFRRSLGVDSWFYHIFDDVPGASFFAKNRDGEIMFASRGILQRYGYTEEAEIIGKTDFDLNPSSFARLYVNDDQLVFKTGEPIRHRLEPWFNISRVPEWHLTTKHPLRDGKRRIIGVMGVILNMSARDTFPGVVQEILPAVEHASLHFRDAISAVEMAKACRISVRKLQQTFRDNLGMTPQDFVMRLRIDQSLQMMLDSNLELSFIATDCGFADQSAFSRKFRALMGESPLRYRKRVLAEPARIAVRASKSEG